MMTFKQWREAVGCPDLKIKDKIEVNGKILIITGFNKAWSIPHTKIPGRRFGSQDWSLHPDKKPKIRKVE